MNFNRTDVIGSENGIKYTINFSFDPQTNVFSWQGFDLLTPEGSEADPDGRKYVTLPSGNFVIQRESIYKEYHLIFTYTGADHLEVVDFEELTSREFSQNGDKVGTIVVPADDAKTMTCNYRRVL